MITRTHRFHGHGSLRFVYSRGQTIRGQYNTLKYIRNSRTASYRVAVVVSRKVSKQATTRNRIRRRVYEVVRQQGIGAAQPFDLVFVVHDEAFAQLSAPVLEKTLKNQLIKAGVLGQTASANPPKGDTISIKENKTKDVYDADRTTDL